MEEELVNPLLADAEGPLLLLEVLALGAPLIGGQLHDGVDVVWVQAVEHLKEEVSLRQLLLSLASWVWKAVSHLW